MRDVFRGTMMAAIILISSGTALAECKKPPKGPQMPQGATATDEDMKHGREQLQIYVNILQEYQKCMEAQIKNAPADTKPEVKQQWAANADAAIDAAHEVADVY
ncbi:MAG TPA: hypothetical protein VH722_18700, partial [Alphaproteobacteria bacterium]|nr:hypothetical protein [Alphaproteobacteria bacterium]